MNDAETPQPDQRVEDTAQPVTEDYPLPPATFEILVLSLRMQAEMDLGLYHFGEEKDRSKPNLRAAQHHIDLLSMLQEKTRGNLTLEEQRMIENSLTELRFRYVQTAQESQNK
jgi:hypothetical protein